MTNSDKFQESEFLSFIIVTWTGKSSSFKIALFFDNGK